MILHRWRRRCALAAAPEGDEQRQQCKERRYHDDVDDLDGSAEILDVGVQPGVYSPQLLADTQLLGLEMIDLVLLFGCQDQCGLVVALALQLSELALGLAQLRLELLLLGAEAVISRAAQLLDTFER